MTIFSRFWQRLVIWCSPRRRQIEESWRRLLAIGPTARELEEIIEKVPALHQRAWRARIEMEMKASEDDGFSVFFLVRHHASNELPEDLKNAIVEWALKHAKFVEYTLKEWAHDSSCGHSMGRGEIEARCLAAALKDNAQLLNLVWYNPGAGLAFIATKVLSQQPTIDNLVELLARKNCKDFHARAWAALLAHPDFANKTLVRVLQCSNMGCCYATLAAQLLLANSKIGYSEFEAILGRVYYHESIDAGVILEATRKLFIMAEPGRECSEDDRAAFWDGLMCIALAVPDCDYDLAAIAELVDLQSSYRGNMFTHRRWSDIFSNYSQARAQVRESAASQFLANNCLDAGILQKIVECVPKYREAAFEKLLPLLNDSPQTLADLRKYIKDEPWFGRYAPAMNKIIPNKSERQVLIEKLCR